MNVYSYERCKEGGMVSKGEAEGNDYMVTEGWSFYSAEKEGMNWEIMTVAVIRRVIHALVVKRVEH